jgi:hypothetical protein
MLHPSCGYDKPTYPKHYFNVTQDAFMQSAPATLINDTTLIIQENVGIM